MNDIKDSSTLEQWRDWLKLTRYSDVSRGDPVDSIYQLLMELVASRYQAMFLDLFFCELLDTLYDVLSDRKAFAYQRWSVAQIMSLGATGLTLEEAEIPESEVFIFDTENEDLQAQFIRRLLNL
jgi:hypothetical protein